MEIYQLYSKELPFEEQFFFDILNYVLFDCVLWLFLCLAHFFSYSNT